MKSVRHGERVLITGGTGSLGYALTKELVAKNDCVVRIFSRDEKKQHDMRQRFPACEYTLGDVRDRDAIRDAVRDVDVVIHGASLKYVDLSEKQPLEYVQTNVFGTINLLGAVLDQKKVRRCVGISSDKVCQAVNTYGFTKAILEKLFIEAVRRQGPNGRTVFTVARYGNVAATRGSVILLWRKREREGLSIPVTNPQMTRFFFLMHEAVELVDKALEQPRGMIVAKRMSAINVMDLAVTMRGNSEIEVVGERPGEKLHEMLLSDVEMAKSKELPGRLILAYDPSAAPVSPLPQAYTSDVAPRLTQDEIRQLLKEIDAEIQAGINT